MSHLHSLAAHTGTRVDTSSRHNMACKIDSRLIKEWIIDGDAALQNDQVEKKMHAERMRYAVQKDELVLNVSKKLFQAVANVAYPLVVSNLADMNSDTKKLLHALYASKTYDEFIVFIEMLSRFKDSNTDTMSEDLLTAVKQRVGGEITKAEARKVGHFPEFRAQGYAQGTGYASHVSGDTVCTIMIGGMATVMNGAFTMHAGDLVQWYFSGEEHLFELENTNSNCGGERKLPHMLARGNINEQPLHKRHKAKNYHDKYAYGMQTITEQHKANAVFRIKPYRMCNIGSRENRQYTEHFGDKCRVFAKCIGGGKPYEMVDIMLMTQSL